MLNPGKRTALILTLLGAALSQAAWAEPVARISKKIEGSWHHAIVADLNSGLVSAEVVHTEQLVSPWKLIGMRQPIAAVTGTFFAWETGRPIAEVLVDGTLVSQGRRGTALGIDWNGAASIIDAPFGREIDWLPFRFGLRGAVRLVRDSVVSPDPKSQGFRDPRIWGSAPRTGAGLTKHGKLILMATAKPMTLSRFGRAMVKMGAVDAISLDGGGSTMLYYRGQMVISTRRPLSNLLVVKAGGPVAYRPPSLAQIQGLW